MKMNKLITTAAVLAFATVALAGAAKAQSFQNGDLLLDFRVTDGTGTGATKDLEIDLGAPSQFSFTTTHTVSNLLVADLTSTYGANWATRGDLAWSVVSANAAGDMYLTFSPSVENSINSSNPAGGATNGGAITGIYSESNGVAATGNGAFVVTTSSGDGSSYTDTLTNVNHDHGPTTYSTDYGFAPFSTEALTSSSGSVLDIYEQTPSARGGVLATSTNLGDFSISGAGVLSFTPDSAEVVPEPSTYALLGLGALALVLMRRRTIKS